MTPEEMNALADVNEKCLKVLLEEGVNPELQGLLRRNADALRAAAKGGEES